MVSYATCKEVAERTGGRGKSLKGGKSWPTGRRWDNAHSYVGWRRWRRAGFRAEIRGRRGGGPVPLNAKHNKSPALWAQMAGSTSHLCAGNNDLPASWRRGRVGIHEKVMRQVCKMRGAGSQESDEGRPNTQYKHTHAHTHTEDNQGCGGTNKLYWEISWGAATGLTWKCEGLPTMSGILPAVVSREYPDAVRVNLI